MLMLNVRNLVKLPVIVAILGLSAQVTLKAQDSLADKEEIATVSKGPKRVVNVEFFGGVLFGYASAEIPNVAENGVVNGSKQISMSSGGLSLGISMHIPVFSVDAKTTIWLIPSLTSGVFLNDFRDYQHGRNSNYSTTVGSAEANMHITYGIGGLRRSNSRWGVEAGIGATYRGSGYGAETRAGDETMEDGARVLPTILVDVSYTPNGVYRLRLMSDIFNSSLLSGVSARQLSVSLVIGW